MALDDADLLREAGVGFHQAVDVAFGLELVEAAERADDLLADLSTVTEALRDLQVLAVPGRLDADEHDHLRIAPFATLLL